LGSRRQREDGRCEDEPCSLIQHSIPPKSAIYKQ
jgi:hypothetical protein